jgi:hypothetical protein
MFAKVLFEDFRNGFHSKKLKGVTAVFDKKENERLRLDDLGNFIVQNTNSRCGGLLDEWQCNLDLAQFAPQCSDGLLTRQNA